MSTSPWPQLLLDRLLASSWEILPWALLVFFVTRPQLNFRPAARAWLLTALALHWMVSFCGVPAWEIPLLTPEPARSAFLESLVDPVSSAPIAPSPLTAGLMIVWVFGACAVVAGWLIQTWRLRRLIRSAQTVDELGWRRCLERQQQALGLRKPVALRLLPSLKTPLALGILRRQVLLPAELVAAGPHSGGAWALAHELSHHARWDLLQSWFAAIPRALFWFHPLAWWLASEQRKNQEEAADEHAMQIEAISAHEYGAWLLGWAQGRQPAWRGSLALASPRYRQLQRRIRMLGLPPVRSTFARRALFSAAILLSLTLLAPWRLVAAPDERTPEPATQPDEVAVALSALAPTPAVVPAPPAPPDSAAFAAMRLVERATELRVMAERLEAEARQLLDQHSAHQGHQPHLAELERARALAESDRARALTDEHARAFEIERERGRLARDLERELKRQLELQQLEQLEQLKQLEQVDQERRERKAPLY